MNPSLSTSFDRLERRLALMHELAAALEAAQAGLLHANLESIEAHTARQQELCQKLLALDPNPHCDEPAIALLPASDVAAPSASEIESDVERSLALGIELRLVEGQVRHLNRVHAALLRRAHLSMAIVARLIGASAITYGPPPPDWLEVGFGSKR